MLSEQEIHRADRYLLANYTLTDTDNEYLAEIDDYIVTCSVDPMYAVKNAEQLKAQAEEVHRKMSAIFIIDGAATPRLLEYQERYYQLLILHRKASGQDDTSALALLCFTSSFDLFWLQASRGSDTFL